MPKYIKSKEERLNLSSTKEFKATNEVWNKLGLNTSWRVGYLTYLCKISGAKTFEEWESFYFKSGEDRLKKFRMLSFFTRQALMDTKPYKKYGIDIRNKLTEEEVAINTKMGRTVDQITTLGHELHKGLVRANIINIPLIDCINFAYIRVIDETWVGTERELNTIRKLQELLPQMEISEVPVEEDSKFAVDCEIFHKNKVICGVQIKSQKYMKDISKVLMETKYINNSKNIAYTNIKGVPVKYVYSEVNGNILNIEVINEIERLAKENIQN